MRTCILTKKNKITIVSIVVLMGISSIFIALFNSPYLNIKSIVVKVEDNHIPPTVVEYLNQYNNKNIFKINCEQIKKEVEKNPFIEKADVKITITKKLTISLIKTEVNAIMNNIEKNSYALLTKDGICIVDDKDKSLINTHLIVIEIKDDVLQALLKKSDLGKFNALVKNLELLNDSSYLISSVKYDNNINNSFGFFKLEFDNTNTEIRVREQVCEQLLLRAIEFAHTPNSNKEIKTVLDVYHEAIIERSMPLGG